MKFNSIRFKIKSFNLCLLAAVFFINYSLLFVSLRHAFYRDLDRELKVKAQEIHKAISGYLDILGYDKQNFAFAVARVARMEGEHPEHTKVLGVENQWLRRAAELGLRRDYVHIVTSPGGPDAGMTETPPGPRSFMRQVLKRGKGEILFQNIEVNREKMRMISTRFHSPGGPNYVVQVGASLRPVTLILGRQFGYSLAIFIVSLFFVHLIDRSFAARILKPVVEVIRAARNISPRDLGARVKTEHIDVEMKYLVDAFNDMISRLEDAFKYIKGISADMAHELRTPLAIIKGEAEVALRKEQTKTDYTNAIRVILEEADQMHKIIEDILLMTRLKYQKEMYSFEKIDFIEFWKEVYEQSELLAADKLKIELSLPDIPIEITANRLHLRRLFFNIIGNAIKFTPAGGALGIRVQKTEDRAIVTIEDNGRGIAAVDLPKIFDRYFSRDSEAMPGKEGLGIGLPIAKNIVELHQGTISVESPPGKGTTVTIVLPLIPKNPRLSPPRIS